MAKCEEAFPPFSSFANMVDPDPGLSCLQRRKKEYILSEGLLMIREVWNARVINLNCILYD